MIMMPYGRCRSSLQLTGTQTSGTPTGPRMGTVQHGDLVPQHEQFGVLGGR